MLVGLIPAVYLSSWLIYTFVFYGAGQLLNIFFGFVAIFIGWQHFANSYFQGRNAKTTISFQLIFILPLIFCLSSLINLVESSHYSDLAKFLMFFLLSTSYLIVVSFNEKNIISFQRILIILLIFSTTIALTIFTQFSFEHYKFLPKISWAYITSNNISYYSTLIAALIILTDYCRFGKIRSGIIICCLVLALIHFSKAHYLSLAIAFLLAFFIRARLKYKIFILFCFFIFTLIIQLLGFEFFEDVVLATGIRPLRNVFYGFTSFPELINKYGFFDAFFNTIEAIGGITRAIIYKNAFDNINHIGLFGVPSEIVTKIFDGRDYHNTFFYVLYEFGYFGFFAFFIMVSLIAKEVLSSKGRMTLFATTMFIYFILRVSFISMDIFWITIYWTIFIMIMRIVDGK